jgi:hypothetical protein
VVAGRLGAAAVVAGCLGAAAVVAGCAFFTSTLVRSSIRAGTAAAAVGLAGAAAGAAGGAGGRCVNCTAAIDPEVRHCCDCWVPDPHFNQHLPWLALDLVLQLP